MNIFGKVTHRILIKNRTRTIVTIIGILLSVSMITAVTVSIVSLQDYLLRSAVYVSGNWYGYWESMSASEMDSLTQEPKIEKVLYAQDIGYADIKSTNEEKPYLYILGVKEDFWKDMPIHLLEGRLPEKEGEILLPKHLQTNGEVSYTIGDTLTLEVGQRFWKDKRLTQEIQYWMEDEISEDLEESEGLKDVKSSEKSEGSEDVKSSEKSEGLEDLEDSGNLERWEKEKLQNLQTKTYTITGIFERPSFENYMSPGYTAITVWEEENIPYVSAWFRTKSPKDILSFEEETKGKYSYQESVWNSRVLRVLGVFSYGSHNAMLYSMGAILIALIMFGSISLIYNAFSISVSERTKQFGLFSSLGATKKQIRRMVKMEAVEVGIIGIPLGILAGIVGMKITFFYIEDIVYSFYGVKETALYLKITPSSIIAAVLISFVTIMVSAWIPSRRAMRVPAIEAIRQNEEIRIRAKEVKTSSLYYKLFGLEGMIASKQFKRNRRKYRTTVASLLMSIVLFISTVSFCQYLTDAVSGTFEDRDYDICYYWEEEVVLGQEAQKSQKEKQNFLSFSQTADILRTAEGVTKCSYIKSKYVDCKLSKADVPEETWQMLFQGFEGNEEQSELTYNTAVVVSLVDEATYLAYLKELGLKETEFYQAKEPLGILMGWNTEFNTETGRMEKRKIIDDSVEELTLTLLDSEKWEKYKEETAKKKMSDEELEKAYTECSYEVKVKIGAYTDTLPFGLNRSTNNLLTIIYPLGQSIKEKENITQGELWSSFYQEFDPKPSRGFIYFKTTDHKQVFENLMKIVKENNLIEDKLNDIYAGSEDSRNMVKVIKIFAYGFIVLISFICLANVFNTITTNVLLRRREFAMLRSVGMSRRGMYKMMNLECILYGVKSLLLGLPIAIGITYVIFLSVGLAYDTAFYISYSAVIISIFIVFLEVFAGMIYAMHKVQQDNPIDALKNENC